MTNKQWHGSALWGKVNHFPGHSVHFPLENIDSTAIFAVFSGKVNHFSANQWHFPPNMRLLASAIFGYAGNTVHASAIANLFALLSASAYICLRQKHCCASAIANLFALLSASAYICLRQKHCSRLGNCKLVCSALGFCDIRLRRKYGSRLGNASPTACITCSARCIRESKASRLLRTKHANANEFALLSASAYICQIFNSHWNEIRENSLLQGFGGKGRKDIHCARRDRDTHFHACRYCRVRKRRLSPGSQR